MSEIFISYASQDRARAQVLAEVLVQQGWSVWWDRTIPSGKRFDQVIQEALAAARCIVVVWSKHSVTSDWVLEEAEEGRKRQILIPVFIEDVPLPMGFRRIQAADLIDWHGEVTALPFQKLVADIATILGPQAKTGTEREALVETKEDPEPVAEYEKQPALARERAPAQPRLPLDQLKEILEAHRKWLESDGKEGERANLSGTNLQAADLVGANLQEATLEQADLQGANLQKANLHRASLHRAILRCTTLKGADLGVANLNQADLRSAVLEGANLERADLRKALLHDTVFRDASLQDANLTEATGLLPEKLAGANLSDAKLPDAILRFERLEVVAETSRNGRKVFLPMLLGCAFSLLSLAATTDVPLLTNAGSSPLPVIGTAIPIAWFYTVAPLLLACNYIYFHLYLQDLWRALGNLPAIFPDGRRLDETAYPWLLNGLVLRHFARLRKKRPPLSGVKLRVCILVAWYSVPLTLLVFWGRYLRRHEWFGTGIHVALLVVSIGFAIGSYQLAKATLGGEERKPFLWSDRRTYAWVAVSIGIAVTFMFLSFGAIEGVPPHLYSPIPSPRAPSLKPTDIRRWVPWAFTLIGYSPFADFSEVAVSTKPPDWRGGTTEEITSVVTGALLKDRNLRYAQAFKAFLVNADLRLTNLEGADLWEADLRGADLRGAVLQQAELIEAKLQRADLRGADLVLANLHDAALEGANLPRADLRMAIGFTASQIKAARNWKFAFYSDEFLKELGLPPDHNNSVKAKLAELEKK